MQQLAEIRKRINSLQSLRSAPNVKNEEKINRKQLHLQILRTNRAFEWFVLLKPKPDNVMLILWKAQVNGNSADKLKRNFPDKT